MIPVLTPDEMRAVDEAAPEPVSELIDRAGAAVAREALAMMGGGYGRTVAVIAGPGHNGDDGRVAADRLRARGVRVTVHDPALLPRSLTGFDLVVDAAYGTGFHGIWTAPDVGRAAVLAVDLPTGVHPLTGVAPVGVLRADRTVTFQAAKPGHVLGDGPDVVGVLRVVDIGLAVGRPAAGIVEASDVAAWIADRSRGAHKWDHAVRVVAGSPGMTGAARLATTAAQRTGASLVAVSSPGIQADAPVEALDRRVPDAEWAAIVLDDIDRFHSLVIGPGLGREPHTLSAVVRTVTDAVVPVVVDGDALFALSWNEDGTPAFLTRRQIPTVLTPHDGEFGLLTGRRPGRDRLAAARHLAATTGAVVLLKGPVTIVAATGHPTHLVTNGDERLATAGTGDVLSGIIGALLATGVAPARAAAGGAWIHAEAARRCPPAGMVAGDVVDAIPAVLQELRP